VLVASEPPQEDEEEKEREIMEVDQVQPAAHDNNNE